MVSKLWKAQIALMGLWFLASALVWVITQNFLGIILLLFVVIGSIRFINNYASKHPEWKKWERDKP